MDQNVNAYISYWCGQSKKLTETIAGPCVCSMHIGVQLTSQRAILSFSNVLVWTVENASEWWCGRKSTDAFSMTTKMCYCADPKLSVIFDFTTSHFELFKFIHKNHHLLNTVLLTVTTMRPNIGMVEYGDHSQVYNSRKLNNKRLI